MTKTVVTNTLALLNEGYVPYEGQIEEAVYARQKCKRKKQASWFVRVTPENVLFVCLGCGRGCSLKNPEGFQAVLPLDGSRKVSVVAGVLPMISDDELLAKKTLLRLDEVCAVLRVSDATARRMIDKGEIVATEALPIRIHTDSVKRYMERTR